MPTRRRFLTTCSSAIPALQAQAARKPNVVLLFADDMGYGDLACYGHPTLRTPHLDRMAEQGIRFTSFYAAASVCTPSRTGLLTGRYAMRAGQPNNTGPDTIGGLPLSEILLPQLLRRQGYRTMAIGKWHLGHTPVEQLPTRRGFDAFFGLPYSNDMIQPWVKTDTPLYLYRNTEKIEQVTDQSRLTERYTDEALRFIRESRQQPFFLYLPFAMPHLPISASSRKGTSRAGLYGDVIETLDWSAGRILDTLRDTGLDNNTLVVFTSDNGPWLDLPARMLQQGNERWHTGSKSLLRGSKGGTYEGGFRVPGIARWPGVIPEWQRNADMVSALDLFPTISAMAGAALPSDRVYDGMDLMPTLRGQAPSPRQEFFFFRGRNLEAIREGPWKFRHARDIGPDGAITTNGPITPQLFHLDIDPAEQYNVAAREPAIAARLHKRLKAFATELGAELP